MALMKINCVIVNYNDADTVINLVDRVHEYLCFDQIVVVDECLHRRFLAAAGAVKG